MTEEEAIPLSSVDLSDGKVSDHPQKLLELNLREVRQRQSRQQIIFLIGIIFVLVFSYGFLCFSNRVLAAIEDGNHFDWHVLLIGSGLILPATLVLFALIRYSFIQTNDAPKADPIDSGDIDLVDRLVEVLHKLAGKS